MGLFGYASALRSRACFIGQLFAIWVLVSGCDAGSGSGDNEGAGGDGAQTSEGSSGGESGETGASGETGDAELKLGPCGTVIECARAIDQPGLVQLIELYGDAGTCWRVEGATAADCWTDCRTLLDTFTWDDDDADACTICLTHSDCDFDPKRPYCGTSGDCRRDVPEDDRAKLLELCELNLECGEPLTMDAQGCFDELRADYFELEDKCRPLFAEFWRCYADGDCEHLQACADDPRGDTCGCLEIREEFAACARGR